MKIGKLNSCIFVSAAHLRLLVLFFFITSSQLSLGQKTKKIELKHANSLEYDEDLGNNAKRLLGNVEFFHEGANMFCDSAYLYENNSMDAFGRVHIQQGDSMHLYGDILKYNGNERKAELFKNIKLTDKDMTLTTDYILYDLKTSIAFYNTGGKIVNKDNTLTSVFGYYNSNAKAFNFKKNVVLVNPEYTINCDTLYYTIDTKIAYFLGATTIKSDENLIYCENGWYNTIEDRCAFKENAYLISENQKLKGDSLYYDRKSSFGTALKNVEIIDTSENIVIRGHKAVYYEMEDYSVVTDSAVLIQIYDKDTLFLHADTLKSIGITSDDPKPIAKKIPKDTVKKDQKILAYHKVKFFKSDMQGKCDSLVYNSTDSTMYLYTDPIIWSDKNQLTATHINMHLKNEEIHTLEMQNNCFIISEEDSTKYNQIKGKKMTGYFSKNELQRIYVEGNGQTIYYAREKKDLIGMNRADCSNLVIYMNDGEVEKITFITKPDAVLYPMIEVKPEDTKLKDFNWRIAERPKNKNEIW